tara:strand:- start:3134 stop:3577 length:444 start_codon:yes stop_codon:yes gene_type:complete
MIVGFAFKKINISRKDTLSKGMKVKYNMDISSISEENVSLSTKQKVLALDFDFTVDYEPDAANLAISGTVNYMAAADEVKKTLDLWKESKKLPKDILILVTNVILDKCNVKALELEQDLNLPTHIPMPSVKVSGTEEGSKNAEQYIG